MILPLPALLSVTVPPLAVSVIWSFFNASGALLPSDLICSWLVTLPKPTSLLSNDILPLAALLKDMFPLESLAIATCEFNKPSAAFVVFSFVLLSNAASVIVFAAVPATAPSECPIPPL